MFTQEDEISNTCDREHFKDQLHSFLKAEITGKYTILAFLLALVFITNLEPW